MCSRSRGQSRRNLTSIVYIYTILVWNFEDVLLLLLLSQHCCFSCRCHIILFSLILPPHSFALFMIYSRPLDFYQLFVCGHRTAVVSSFYIKSSQTPVQKKKRIKMYEVEMRGVNFTNMCVHIFFFIFSRISSAIGSDLNKY